MRKRINTSRTMGAVMAIACAAAACGPGPGGEDGGTADAGSDGGGATALTWGGVQSDILTSCTASQCHAAGNTSGVIAYEGADLHTRLLSEPTAEVPSMRYIEAGDPQASYLYRKLEGTQEAACTDAGLIIVQCGERMPRIGGPMSADLLEGLRLWIVAGAAKN